MLKVARVSFRRDKTTFKHTGAETNKDDCHAGNRGQGDEGVEYLTTEARHRLSLSYFRQCPAFRASFRRCAEVVPAVRAGLFAVSFMMHAAASGRGPNCDKHGE